MRAKRFLAACTLAGVVAIPAVASAGNSQPEGPVCLPANRMSVLALARSGNTPRSFVGTEFAYRDEVTGAVMVQARFLTYGLGGQVWWRESNRTAAFTYEKHQLSIQFPHTSNRSSTAKLDGRTIPFDSFLCEGRTYVSIHSLGEAFQVPVRWYAEAKTIIADPLANVTKPGGKTAKPSLFERFERWLTQ